MTATTQANDIARIVAPSPEVFRRQYLKPGKPVIIQGLMDSWKASRLWSPDYFKERVGSKEVVVQVAPDGVFGLNPEEGGPRLEPQYMPFSDYVDRLGSQNGGLRYYLQRLSIPHALPELMEDFSLPPYVKANRVYLMNLWFGPGGNITRLHYDVPNNFLAQVYGRKRFVIFPPRASASLYPYRTKAYNMSRVDLDHPDKKVFPNFGTVKPIEFVLNPGEVIFLPSFWWHQVYSLDMGISINFWCIPRLRHLAAPQIFDTITDVVKEGWRFFIHKSGSTFSAKQPAKPVQ